MNSRQLSFIITLCSMGILVTSLFIVKLRGKQLDEFTYELTLEEEMVEELVEAEPRERIRSHRIFNQDARIEEPEPIRPAEEILNELREDENQQESEDSEAEGVSDDYSNYLEELRKKRMEKARMLEEKNKKEEDQPARTAYTSNRHTSAYFSLKDRDALYIPLPVYTCIQGGEVVINIEVDNEGYVTEATFNNRASNTNNGCLVDNAIEYARKARFSKGSSAEQIGTITFLFEGK